MVLDESEFRVYNHEVDRVLNVLSVPLHIGVIDDSIKVLVHYANGADIETVIVDGKTVVEARRMVGLAEDTFLHGAQHTWEGYEISLVAREPRGHSADELYPLAFAIRQSR